MGKSNVQLKMDSILQDELEEILSFPSPNLFGNPAQRTTPPASGTENASRYCEMSHHYLQTKFNYVRKQSVRPS